MSRLLAPRVQVAFRKVLVVNHGQLAAVMVPHQLRGITQRLGIPDPINRLRHYVFDFHNASLLIQIDGEKSLARPGVAL